MPLDPVRWNATRIVWFIIDGHVSWDKFGWEFWLRTPLFGLQICKNYPSPEFCERQSWIYFSLLARWPVYEGQVMYRYEWKKLQKPKVIIMGAS